MSFEAGFILAAIIHVGVVAVSLYLYWQNRRYALTLHEIERFGISAGQGEVPTIVMEAERPVEIILPKGRKLWVRALPVAMARRWRQEFLVFYASNLTAIEMLPFLQAEQAENKDLLRITAGDFARTFINGGMQKQVIRLLKKTLLSVSLCNPGKVSAGWIARNCSEIKIAEMLLVVYAYNNGAYIKKKLATDAGGNGQRFAWDERHAIVQCEDSGEGPDWYRTATLPRLAIRARARAERGAWEQRELDRLRKR